jgi:branched-chain amino acid transport system permease protein
MLFYALAAGVLFGLYFTLVGLGLNLVFGVMRIVNLAHGDFLMLGAYLACWLFARFGLHPLAAAPIAALLFLVLGWPLYYLLVARLLKSRDAEMLSLILFFGLSQLIEALSAITFGASERSIPGSVLGRGPVVVFGAALPYPWLFGAGLSGLSAGAVYLFLYRSRTGMLMRAVMESREEALASGIDIHRVSAAAFAIGIGLAGLAGVLAPFMLGSVTPSIGMGVNLTAFTVIVLGTLGDPLGTILGGIIYGLSLMLMQTYLSSWADLLPSLMLVGVLLVFPRGLLAPSGQAGADFWQPGTLQPARGGRGTVGRRLALAAALLAAVGLGPLLYSNQLLLFNFVIFLALAQGLNLLYGFTGYLPFGYAGFFGAGAYGFALAVMHLRLGAELALICAGVAALGLGLLLTPLLRLSGAYFAIANLAAAQAVYQVVSNPALEGVTRGPYGVSLSGVFAPQESYAAAALVLAGALGLVIWLQSSRFGLGLRAIRDDPLSAALAGIAVVARRTMAWLLSALVAGLAGAAFAWHISVFYPEAPFDIAITMYAIVFVLFGGSATLGGPVLGVLVLYGLYNAIGITTPQYSQLIYGGLVVVLALFLPDGLASLPQRLGLRGA